MIRRKDFDAAIKSLQTELVDLRGLLAQTNSELAAVRDTLAKHLEETT